MKRDLYILETNLNKEEIESALKEAKDDSMTIQVKKDTFYVQTYNRGPAYVKPPGSHGMIGRIEPMEVGSRIILEADRQLGHIRTTKIVSAMLLTIGALDIIQSKSISMLIVYSLWCIFVAFGCIYSIKEIRKKCAKFEDRILEFLESKLDARRYEE